MEYWNVLLTPPDDCSLVNIKLNYYPITHPPMSFLSLLFLFDLVLELDRTSNVTADQVM